MPEWEPVIGLEIHVQLKTHTKMFCGCEAGFGGEPNTRTCPVCLAFPGALPVPNETAVEWTIKLGHALNCRIAERAVFHRKNYFYPDNPKGYQISQYDEPLCIDGSFVVPGPDGDGEVGIVRAHLEEDAAKTIHVGGATGRIVGSAHSNVDFNRGGTPLVEIVTQPDLRSADEAKRFLQLLRQTIVEIGISDAEMEKGTLRADANVSVREVGEAGYRTRTELKNMNSFNHIARGIEAELRRQIETWESGGEVVQETLDYEVKSDTVTPRRRKEEADDYRYFPEPDLVPVEPESEIVERLRNEVPELPGTRIPALRDAVRASVLRRRSAERLGRPRSPLRAGRPRRHRREGGVERADERLRRHRSRSGGGQRDGACEADRGASDDSAGVVHARAAGERRSGVPRGDISRRHARGRHRELEPLVERVLSDNPGQVAAYKGGKEGLLGFFVGQVMKETNGKADPKVVNELLRAKLA